MAAIFLKSFDLILKVAGGVIGLGAVGGISAYAYDSYPSVIDTSYQPVELVPHSHKLQNRDDWDLTDHMYLNKDVGQVRISLDQAQELFMREIMAGKPFYPGKATLPKKDEPDTNAPAPSEQKKK